MIKALTIAALLAVPVAAPVNAASEKDVIAGVFGGMLLGGLLAGNNNRNVYVQPAPQVYVQPAPVIVQPRYCDVIENTVYSGQYVIVRYVDTCTGRLVDQQVYHRW